MPRAPPSQWAVIQPDFEAAGLAGVSGKRLEGVGREGIGVVYWSLGGGVVEELFQGLGIRD